VLRAAETGEPQFVSRHGTDVAVVVDIATYQRLSGTGVDLKEVLLGGPRWDELDLEIVRSREFPREVDLGPDEVGPGGR